MNPVCSYNDFLRFLRHSHTIQDRLIPVLLIKPIDMLYMNQESLFERAFDYLDCRSGKHLHFFIPGYAHYPDLSFTTLLSSYPPCKEDAVAITAHRLGKIYYSNNAFVDFVERIERESPYFHYYGDMELMLIRYKLNAPDHSGALDFTELHRFNLSTLYFAHRSHDLTARERLLYIERFIENVIMIYQMHFTNEEAFLRAIQECYNGIRDAY